MIINIQTPHIKLTEKQEANIFTELEKIEKMLPRAESCQVLIKEIRLENKNLMQAEINLQVPGGKIFALERGESLENNMKELIKKMKRRIIKFRDNQRKKRLKTSEINRNKFWELQDL